MPACEASTYKVHACIQIDTMAPGFNEPPFDFEATGVVTAVRAPQAGDVINGYQYCTQLDGEHADPDVLIDLEQPDGTAFTVSFAAPGFSQSSVAQGETLGVRYHRELYQDVAGWVKAKLEITRDDALVAGAGVNLPVGPPSKAGAETCFEEWHSSIPCPRVHKTMEVTKADGTTVSIAEDESVEVDGLLVTNELYFRHYDDGCNFGLPVEYVMSAVAQ